MPLVGNVQMVRILGLDSLSRIGMIESSIKHNLIRNRATVDGLGGNRLCNHFALRHVFFFVFNLEVHGHMGCQVKIYSLKF